MIPELLLLLFIILFFAALLLIGISLFTGRVSTIAGTLVRGFGGYMATAFVRCHILYPDSNQCDLPAVFIGGPIGVFIGWIAGALVERHRRQ